MKTVDIETLLSQLGVPFEATRDQALSLSERLIRVADGARLGCPHPVVVVGDDYPKLEEQPGDALIAGVDWLLNSPLPRTNRLTVILALPKPDESVLTPFRTLASSLNGVAVDLALLPPGTAQPAPLPPGPGLAGLAADPNASKLKKWWKNLDARPAVPLPPLAINLEAQVGCPSFRWYLPSGSSTWSGRVEGLQVCTVTVAGLGTLELSGGPSATKKSTIRQEFNRLVQVVRHSRGIVGPLAGPFGPPDLPAVADVVRRLVASRKSGVLRGEDREHHLEARILRDAVVLDVAGRRLRPAAPRHPFQFPTLWNDEPGSRPRYLDALMRDGPVPWAVEIKVNTNAGPGTYYRHGLTQAVLYREFIRAATALHPWFTKQGMDALDCRGMLVIEPMRTKAGAPHPQRASRTARLRALASCFGVEVLERS